MTQVYSNIYYFYYLNVVGGTETFLYQLAKKFKDYDLTVVYTKANPEQVARLRQYVRCIKYEGQEIYCKKAFFNYGVDIINHVHADEYNLVIHADYEALMKKIPDFKPQVHPKINRYIGVSKRACAGFKAVTGKDCELCYNPFTPEKPRKVLNLISATRLTKEKGKDRMIQLGDALDRAGIPYIWTVFTNDTKEINNPNIIYMKPRLDITNFIANADYLVQLSDNEGYCYSVVEALTQGVPVIVTHCPVFDELGLKNGKNCYLLDFDMQNIPVNDIYNKIPKDFHYEVLKDDWENHLLLEPTTYDKEQSTIYLMEATNTYQERGLLDAELGRVPVKGERWETDYNRMYALIGNNKYHAQFAKVIDSYTQKEKEARQQSM